MKFNFKELLPHLVSVIVIILINIIYFFPQFEGKKLPQGDIISYKGMAQEINTYSEKEDKPILWTNSMFGGMPSYQIKSQQEMNFSQYYTKILHVGFSRPAGYFIMGMLCFYLTLLLLKVNPWVSLISSIMFAFSTGNLILYEAGHTSKIQAIMTSAPIIAGVLLTLRRQYLLGGFIFTLFLSINLYANHPQMTYYLGLALGILMVMYFVKSIKEGAIVDYGKAVAILLLGAALSIGTFASKTLTTMEYAEDTMRGKPILENTTGNITSSSETDGLEWSYAMNWSNGFADLLTAWIPKVVGGGSTETVSKDSNFARLIGSRVDTQAPLYFGKLPFTAGPLYLGVVVFFLFFLGFFINENRLFTIWLGLAVLFTMLLSMGSNLEWFNRLFFDYFPMFNKFRTPNSVISVTGIFVPILAGLTLNTLIKKEDKSELIKPFMIGTGVMAIVTLLIALVGPSLIDLNGPYDSNLGDARLIDALKEDRMDVIRSSSFRSLGFILAVAVAIFAYLKGKLNAVIMVAVIGVMGLMDLVPIGTDYLGHKDFVTARQLNNNFTPRAVDQQILNDTDPYYRVHDVSVDPFNSSRASYFHKTIGGYHPAKLQRIQDVIDRHISQGNQAVLNMLNTKYFIIGGDGNQPVAQRNPAALGNAWFVNDVTMVNSANEEISALNNIDPSVTAVIHNEFLDYVSGMNVSKNGSIQLTSYHPEKLTYKSSSSSEQLAVFSDIYYGPDKGWKAYVDGEEMPFIRANYLLRAMKIPAGEHEVVFEFHPQSYYTGETISLISSLLILGLGLFYGVNAFRNRAKEEE